MFKKYKKVFLYPLLLLILGCGDNTSTEDKTKAEVLEFIPRAAKKPHLTSIHGIDLSDNYFWLKDKLNPEVLAYLKDENQYADSLMQHTIPLQDELYAELKSRLPQTEESVPYQLTRYNYYTRFTSGAQYPVNYRKALKGGKPEKKILDLNIEAAGHSFFHMGNFEISPDEQLLAYTTDLTGSEDYTLLIRHIDTNEVIDSIPEISSTIAWANDNQTIFYTTHNVSNRPDKVYRHKVGMPYTEDKLVFEEEDERFDIVISRSKNGEYLVIDVESQVSTEVHLIEADNPNQDPVIFSPRKQGVIYRVFPHGTAYYILTNDEAENFKLMKAPEGATDTENWQQIVAEKPDVTIEEVEVFKDYITINENHQGINKIKVINSTTLSEKMIDFPDPAYAIFFGHNPDFKSKSLKFEFISLTSPAAVYALDLVTFRQALLREDKIKGFEPGNLVAERIFAMAADGTKIPISLVYKKGLTPSAKNPLYLYGYGSYGFTTFPPYFTAKDFNNRLSLLERGFVFAIAHVRGSGDMGSKWYHDGKLTKKKNTFTDFIACGEHLVKEGYTSNAKMVAMGGSAGGLLMGVVANSAPNLFHAIIAKVPFVDMMNTMLDPELPLTVAEYEEWGNPNDKDAFDYMLSYAPYDNIKSQKYPHMLITASLNDTRVSYWEPAKWTAKLRDYNTGSNKILFKTNMAAGHEGSSGRFDYLAEVVYEYAFVIDLVQ